MSSKDLGFPEMFRTSYLPRSHCYQGHALKVPGWLSFSNIHKSWKRPVSSHFEASGVNTRFYIAEVNRPWYNQGNSGLQVFTSIRDVNSFRHRFSREVIGSPEILDLPLWQPKSVHLLIVAEENWWFNCQPCTMARPPWQLPPPPYSFLLRPPQEHQKACSKPLRPESCSLGRRPLRSMFRDRLG